MQPTRSSQGKQKKIDTVKDLTDKLTRAKSLVLTDPTGLTHKQIEELRKLLKKAQADFTITKNRLLQRALSQVKKKLSDEHFIGATATVIAYEDEVSPIKELTKFFKKATFGKIKAGLLGETELSLDEVERMSQLPSRDVLLAQLVGQLQAPVYGLHNALSWNIRKLVYALDSVKNKKQ